MKITDVTVTLIEWVDLPDVSYHFIRRKPGEVHDQGLVTIHTDEGIEGRAFLGKEITPASADAKELIRLMKPILRTRIRSTASGCSRRCAGAAASARSARWARSTSHCGTLRARRPRCRSTS